MNLVGNSLSWKSPCMGLVGNCWQPAPSEDNNRLSSFHEALPIEPASYNKTMPKLRRHVPVALALILGLTTSSCLYTKRVILRRGKKVTAATAPALLTATRDELNARIATLYNAINSFQATVDMTPSIGSVYTNSITEIKDVRAHVLFRKPAEIRILGQYPVVRTTAFDMVSDGTTFKVLLVSKNLFVEGANSEPATSKNKLENLRPEAFLSSMLIRPADPATETPALVDNTDEDNALYILYFIKKVPNGDLLIARSVWFDRIDLSIVRQQVYDEAGALVSDTRYTKWRDFSGVMFPSRIDINRDKDGYGVVLDVLENQMNVTLTDDKFVLNQPEGSQLRAIGATK
jgi:outer membrane lipoprotein-sorting protein